MLQEFSRVMESKPLPQARRARRGAWSIFVKYLRPITHLGALLPLAVLAWDAATDNLTVNPIQAITFRTGRTALNLLMLSLACTPLASVFGFKEALKVRRALGLYAFLYVSLHFLIFAGLDFTFNLKLIGREIAEKPYIIAGLSAGLALLPLAITSFTYWMRRLGKNWKRLHRLVYAAGVLAIIHYLWEVKADIRVPLLYGAILVTLLLLRISPIKKAAIALRKKAFMAFRAKSLSS
jgi:sulfoxide reductase heme-binding subunit YedZ